MKIVLKATPKIVTAKTKSALMAKLKVRYISSSTKNSRFSGYQQYDDKYVGINFEKHRKKVESIKPNKKSPTGFQRIIKESYWIAYVYTFDKVLFDALHMELKQNTRNFTLVHKKQL
jgi:hypothetical protein